MREPMGKKGENVRYRDFIRPRANSTAAATTATSSSIVSQTRQIDPYPRTICRGFWDSDHSRRRSERKFGRIWIEVAVSCDGIFSSMCKRPRASQTNNRETRFKISRSIEASILPLSYLDYTQKSEN